MKCTIPGANLKIFAKAIHSLSKIGDELYIEPLEHGLSLRTVNSSRSAYACFVFAPTFFLHYVDSSTINQDAVNQEEAVKCKIGMKTCLTVFKSLSTLEKSVDRCKIAINMEQARLIFQMHCKHGIVKTHNLAFIECETLQAVFSKEMSPNILTAQSRLLTDVVLNFQTTQEEVSLIVSPEKVVVKNYIEDDPDPQKVIFTEMSLDHEEFDTYQVGVDTEVTFCLKELRAILAFTESNSLPLTVNFETAGKPIVVSVDSDPTFEANFVLATLADRSSQVSVSQQDSVSQSLRTPAPNIHSIHTPRVNHRAENQDSILKNKTPSFSNDQNHRLEPHMNSVDNPAVRSKSKSRSRAQLLGELSKDLNSTRKPETAVDENSMDRTTSKSNSENSNVNNCERSVKSKNRRSSCDKNEDSRVKKSKSGTKPSSLFDNVESCTENDVSPIIPVMQTSKKKITEEMEEEEEIPGTPPSKKQRSTLGFFGISSQNSSCQTSSSQSSSVMTTSVLSTRHTVLAADTDSDDD